METTNTSIGKPIPLRIIFIFNALMMILPFVFYYIFTSKGIVIEGLEPIFMVYTGVGYILSFITLVYFILRRSITGVRAIILINVLIALPTKAYIGIGIAILSMILTFNSKVKAYLHS